MNIKIDNLNDFAKDHNHSIDFRFDKNDFWIGVYAPHGTSIIFVQGFHGNLNDKYGRNLEDIIRQVKIFITNNIISSKESQHEFIKNLPIAP